METVNRLNPMTLTTKYSLNLGSKYSSGYKTP